jgi:hypothetical protein
VALELTRQVERNERLVLYGADLIMAWLQPQSTRERPDTFTQTALGICSSPLHGRGEPYISR